LSFKKNPKNPGKNAATLSNPSLKVLNIPSILFFFYTLQSPAVIYPATAGASSVQLGSTPVDLIAI
jgi:hypothetical protein